jgi:hypothetical protein
MKKDYQLGLLHIAHSLINTDGRIDDREMDIILKIKTEEHISDEVFLEFSRGIALAKGRDIFNRGLDLLNRCTEEEKLCAFVYLFKLAEADDSISMKEVRLLMDALKITNVDFKDISLISNLASSNESDRG